MLYHNTPNIGKQKIPKQRIATKISCTTMQYTKKATKIRLAIALTAIYILGGRMMNCSFVILATWEAKLFFIAK
jgi:hypothetical protein